MLVVVVMVSTTDVVTANLVKGDSLDLDKTLNDGY